MHRAVLGHVNVFFGKAAEQQLLDICSVDVEVCPPFLSRIQKYVAPVTKLRFVSRDHILADFVAVCTSGRAKCRNAVARTDTVNQHQISDRSFGDSSGSPAPTSVDSGYGPGICIRDQYRETICGLNREQYIGHLCDHRIALGLRPRRLLRRLNRASIHRVSLSGGDYLSVFSSKCFEKAATILDDVFFLVSLEECEA